MSEIASSLLYAGIFISPAESAFPDFPQRYRRYEDIKPFCCRPEQNDY
ncbi:hypothetical protein ASZ90_008912 [hydrocarbon metagenome]|uniref:Uncharacterized protein n=1 Tax=hydrocarbon metagenome TaxID=938273 RepID=A0A0W8FK93_9ZZZZ